MVSNAREDLPLPEMPVKTISRSRGSSRWTFLRLCSRAPWMTIESVAMPGVPSLLLVDRDRYDAVLDLDRERRDRFVGGADDGLAGRDVEHAAVQRALDLVLLDEVPF